jgi:hypothetical protein
MLVACAAVLLENCHRVGGPGDVGFIDHAHNSQPELQREANERWRSTLYCYQVLIASRPWPVSWPAITMPPLQPPISRIFE